MSEDIVSAFEDIVKDSDGDLTEEQKNKLKENGWKEDASHNWSQIIDDKEVKMNASGDKWSKTENEVSTASAEGVAGNSQLAEDAGKDIESAKVSIKDLVAGEGDISAKVNKLEAIIEDLLSGKRMTKLFAKAPWLRKPIKWFLYGNSIGGIVGKASEETALNMGYKKLASCIADINMITGTIVEVSSHMLNGSLGVFVAGTKENIKSWIKQISSLQKTIGNLIANIIAKSKQLGVKLLTLQTKINTNPKMFQKNISAMMEDLLGYYAGVMKIEYDMKIAKTEKIDITTNPNWKKLGFTGAIKGGFDPKILDEIRQLVGVIIGMFDVPLKTDIIGKMENISGSDGGMGVIKTELSKINNTIDKVKGIGSMSGCSKDPFSDFNVKNVNLSSLLESRGLEVLGEDISTIQKAITSGSATAVVSTAVKKRIPETLNPKKNRINPKGAGVSGTGSVITTIAGAIKVALPPKKQRRNNVKPPTIQHPKAF